MLQISRFLHQLTNTIQALDNEILSIIKTSNNSRDEKHLKRLYFTGMNYTFQKILNLTKQTSLFANLTALKK